MNAPVCSSWVWVCRYITKRSEFRPLGDRTLPFVCKGHWPRSGGGPDDDRFSKLVPVGSTPYPCSHVWCRGVGVMPSYP